MDSSDKENLHDSQAQNDLEDIDNSAGSCLYDLSQPLVLDETESSIEGAENDEHKDRDDDSTEIFDGGKDDERIRTVTIDETVTESRLERKTLGDPTVENEADGVSESKNDIFDKETQIETMEEDETERTDASESKCDIDDDEDIVRSSQSQNLISEIKETSLLRKRKSDDDISQSPKKISKTEPCIVETIENSTEKTHSENTHSENFNADRTVEDGDSAKEESLKENDTARSYDTPRERKESAERARDRTGDRPISNVDKISSDSNVVTDVRTDGTGDSDREASVVPDSNRTISKTLEKNSDALDRNDLSLVDRDGSKIKPKSQNTSESGPKDEESQNQKETQIVVEQNSADTERMEDDKETENAIEIKNEDSLKKNEIDSVIGENKETGNKNSDPIETDEENPKIEPDDIEEISGKRSSPNTKSLNSSYEATLINTMKVCSTPRSDGENAISNHENENFDGVKSQNISDLDTCEKSQFSVRRRTFYVEVEYSVHQNEQSKESGQKEIRHVTCEDICDIHKHPYANSDLSSGILSDISKSVSPSSMTGSSTSSALNRLSTLSNASRLSTLSRHSTSSTVSCVSSVGSVLSTETNRHENFVLPGLPVTKSKEKSLVQYQKLTNEQIDTIKTQWNNTDQLLKILDFIDHAPRSRIGSPNDLDRLSSVLSDRSSMHFNSIEMKSTDRSDSEETLKTIKEVVTPRSTKKKTGGNRKSNRSSDVNQNVASKSTIDDNVLQQQRVVKSAKRTKRMPSVSTGHEKQSTPEREVPPGDSDLSIGLPVFARWTDRKYYSGVIDAYVKEGKWSVKFDDGNKKTLIEEFIIKDCHTLLKGQSVYAIVGEDGEYDSGIVSSTITRQNTVKYEVEVDKGTKTIVTAQQLFLTEDQAKSIRETIAVTPPNTPKRMGIISLDNIVDGKRVTRSKHQRTPIASPKPGISGTRKRLEIEDSKSGASEDISGIEAEFKTDTPTRSSKGPGRVKGLSKTDRRSAKSKLRETIDESLLGPIPEEGSELFADLSFILNCAKPILLQDRPAVKKTDSTESSVGSATETETETMEFTKVPLIEEHLRAQITAGGGKVYRRFEDVPPEEYPNLKLISNRPNKTLKYIQCMASGIMILSHEWIVNCCKQNERRMFQELPYGWSVEQNRFIDSFQRQSSKPLKDLHVTIAPNRDARFVDFWKRICETAGGTVNAMESDDDDFKVTTFVLADNECPEKIIKKALACDVPLLSTHWIVQSLIHGEARSFNGNEKYAYNYTEFN